MYCQIRSIVWFTHEPRGGEGAGIWGLGRCFAFPIFPYPPFAFVFLFSPCLALPLRIIMVTLDRLGAREYGYVACMLCMHVWGPPPLPRKLKHENISDGLLLLPRKQRFPLHCAHYMYISDFCTKFFFIPPFYLFFLILFCVGLCWFVLVFFKKKKSEGIFSIFK